MKAVNFVFFVIIVIIIGAVGFYITTYNKLQVMDETATANWAQVENQLKRRNDLIPNLVNTVKGYAAHENVIFTDIAEARAKLSGSMDSNDVESVQKNTNELNGALSRLLVIVENYPNLKANKAFISLQDELTGTENRLTVARRDYNESVKTINALIRTFPTSVVANIAKIEQRKYFEITEAEKAAPKVEF